MNSMFSSFDAVCAEFMGQTVRASLPNCGRNRGDVRAQQSLSTTELKAAAEKTNTKGGDSTPPPPACTRRPPQMQKKAPAAARFAPELDGLNCFETLISY